MFYLFSIKYYDSVTKENTYYNKVFSQGGLHANANNLNLNLYKRLPYSQYLKLKFKA